MEETELRVRYGDYVLRAKLSDEPTPSIEVQWLRRNGQPAHQPIYFDCAQAPEMLRALAAFAETVRARQG